jgi:hypothetical protein
MKVTDFTRKALKIRREYRDLTAEGYRKAETDWEINRGHLMDHVIVDAKISACGRYVYTKIGLEEGKA